MNKGELIAAMADRSGVNQGQAGDCLEAFFDIICDQVGSGGEVNVTGYIKFTQVDRAARMGRNPQTGEAIHVPATKAVKISAGSKLKKAAKSGMPASSPQS